MFEIKANPLRISTFVFTFVIILFMLIRKFIPGDYKVAVEDSLSPEITGNEVTFKELHSMLQQDDASVQFVDIRSEEDYKKSHLEGAVNIPVEKLFDRKSRKTMRKKTNVIYCSTESMAHSAAYLLKQCGYDCRPVNGNYTLIKANVIDKFNPSLGFYSDEKQQYNYPDFIKQHEAPTEFKVDKKEEVKIQSGC